MKGEAVEVLPASGSVDGVGEIHIHTGKSEAEDFYVCGGWAHFFLDAANGFEPLHVAGDASFACLLFQDITHADGGGAVVHFVAGFPNGITVVHAVLEHGADPFIVLAMSVT